MENTQPVKEEISNISTIAEAIGDGIKLEQMDWVQENITSIQHATTTGKHDKLVYPACGTDILRTMVAFDATEIEAIDTGEELVARIAEQFEKAKIPLSIAKVDESTDELTCSYNGKTRKITFKKQDARLVLPNLEPGSVDVLHVFLPTGANFEMTELDVWLESKFGDEWMSKQGTEEVEELLRTDPGAPQKGEDGKYKKVGTHIVSRLNQQNYSLVSAGGFMVFDEQRLTQLGEVPTTLLDIAKIKELEITKRHPFTVSTSLYPTEEEVVAMDRKGYIYQKSEAVSQDIINDVLEGVEVQETNEYALMEMQRGAFEYIGIDGEHADIMVAVAELTNERASQTDKVAEQMLAHGVPVEQIQAYRLEQRAAHLARLQRIQTEYQEFLAAYRVVLDKVKAKSIGNQEALEELGIVQGKYRKESRKWPIALAYLRDANKPGLQTTNIVEQFAELDLTKLQNL